MKFFTLLTLLISLNSFSNTCLDQKLERYQEIQSLILESSFDGLISKANMKVLTGALNFEANTNIRHGKDSIQPLPIETICKLTYEGFDDVQKTLNDLIK